jgi:hypothetical protein
MNGGQNISFQAKLKWEPLEFVMNKLGSGGRVRYSCLDINSTILVLGANTGSIYFFEREAARFITLVSPVDNRDPLHFIKIKSFEPSGWIQLSFCTSKNTLYIMDINLLNRKEKDKVILKHQHKEEISCLLWDNDGTNLFFGDVTGSVYVVSLKVIGLFLSPELVHKMDSAIVQIEVVGSQIVIASLTRTAIATPGKFQQIGSQLRDGRY